MIDITRNAVILGGIMNATPLLLTRIVVGHTYGEAPPEQRERNILIDHPQTHQYVDKVVIGDMRELLKAAHHLIGSLDEANLKPAGLTALRDQLAAFNIDGPRY